MKNAIFIIIAVSIFATNYSFEKKDTSPYMGEMRYEYYEVRDDYSVIKKIYLQGKEEILQTDLDKVIKEKFSEGMYLEIRRFCWHGQEWVQYPSFYQSLIWSIYRIARGLQNFHYLPRYVGRV